MLLDIALIAVAVIVIAVAAIIVIVRRNPEHGLYRSLRDSVQAGIEAALRLWEERDLRPGRSLIAYDH
jgi:flagellar biosynthesis/type III secretory pathway M-ring protein FliF/YscJ